MVCGSVQAEEIRGAMMRVPPGYYLGDDRVSPFGRTQGL
jgi:hypothetical protein